MPRASPSRVTRLLIAALGGAALVAACGEGTPAGPGAGEPAASPTQSAPAPTDGVTVGPGLKPVVDAAVAELAAASQSDGGPVRVVLARRETFPDGAVGCPQPGKSYTQALVEGFRVVLAKGDRFWLFTAGPDGAPRLCRSGEEDGGTESPPPGVSR